MPASVNKTGNGDPPSDQDFEEIQIAEEELIDAYVRDELSVDERKLLEKGLKNSSHLVDRLHFARLLADTADRAQGEVASDQQQQEFPPSPKPWWQFVLLGPQPALNLAFVSCALIVVVGGLGLVGGWISLRRESQQLAEQQVEFERQKLELQKSASEQRLATDEIRAQLREEQLKREADQQLIAELQQAQNQKSVPSAATVATLFLLPASRAPENEKELRPPPGTSEIRLQLAVDSIDYRDFLVQVKNSQDREIFQQKIRPPRSGKLITLTVRSNVLPTGGYSLQLNGISAEGTSELVGNYSFRIAAIQK